MTKPHLLLAFTLLALPLPVPAQDARAEREWHSVARVAKWVLAGATIVLGAYAYSEHQAAERAHDRLRDRCDTSPDSCTVEDGRYRDAELEAMHQVVIRHDRQARTGIVAGQITLLGGVALFLYDLRGGRGPDNIPYPSARRAAWRVPALMLGTRVPF